MDIRRSIVNASCWVLGGHKFLPSMWRHDAEPQAWVREVECVYCRKPLRVERVRSDIPPLNIWSGV